MLLTFVDGSKKVDGETSEHSSSTTTFYISRERVLIQPYSMIISIQRNLCPWNTVLPAFDLDVKMGVFKVSVFGLWCAQTICSDDRFFLVKRILHL